MKLRRTLPGLLGVLALGLAFGSAPGTAADEKGGPRTGKMSPAAEKCVKECANCARECESCFKHCVELLAQGNKHHVHTLQTCNDCGDFCVLAAKVMTRQGPLSVQACDGCAKACDACGKACEEHGGGDPKMKACAQACKACAAACREFIKSAGGADHKH